MKRIAMAWCVHPDDARRWLEGDDSDPDLLGAAVDYSPLGYVARMTGKRDWKHLATMATLFKPSGVLFRTERPGLVRLIEHCGGYVTATERDGSKRCFISGEGWTKLLARLAPLA